MDRRSFTHLCSGLLAGAAALSHQTASATGKAASTTPTRWPVSRLINANGEPLDYNALEVGSSHIFSYPYRTTPCFLIRLKPAAYGQAELQDKSGQTYQWQGGAGPDHSLVAFSAICTHKMTHPAKPISHLNFRPEEKEYVDQDGVKRAQQQLISCCSEYSLYDPAQGAKVLSGPATQPLAAISLAVDSDGQINATGTYGGNMYDEFLTKFGFRLAMENKVSDPRTLVEPTTVATRAENYSQQQIRC